MAHPVVRSGVRPVPADAMQRMTGFTPARRRALMVLPIAILILMGAATLMAYARVGATRAQVVEARAVIRASERLLTDLTDAETGQRGYLLTGRERYLSPYLRATSALRVDSLELRLLLSGDAQQMIRLRQLLPVIQDKMYELGQTVALRRQGDERDALALVESDRGRRLMDAARLVLAAVRDGEMHVLEGRLASEAGRGRLLLLVFGGGLLLVIYSIVRGNRALAGYAVAQQLALGQISQQNEELSAQRDTLEESAAEMEMLNEALLERTRAAELAHAETEAERRRLEQLHELTVALSAATTPADVAHVAGLWGRTVMGAATALVVVPTEDGSALEPVEVSGLPPDFVARWPRIPCDVQAVIVEAACRGRIVQAGSAQVRHELFPALELYEGLEAALAAPLLLDGRRLGAWAIYFDRPREFSAAELRLFEGVTEQCAQAMERARLFQAERRARAEAERANAAKVNFLSVMSHDVRTPLNAILGYAELLHGGYMGELQERQREFLGRILASTTVLRTLVEEVLEYARIEAGRLEIRSAELQLAPLLDRVETVVAPQAVAKGIALLRDAPPPVRVQGDADRIGQILANLVTNAIKYTQAGGEVTVETTADERAVEFRVGDNGPGIDPGDLDRIFEPFVQLEHARENEVGGVGLGLAISRELARAMGGELRAESRPGRTTFTLRLPRGHAEGDGVALSA